MAAAQAAPAILTPMAALAPMAATSGAALNGAITGAIAGMRSFGAVSGRHAPGQQGAGAAPIRQRMQRQVSPARSRSNFHPAPMWRARLRRVRFPTWRCRRRRPNRPLTQQRKPGRLRRGHAAMPANPKAEPSGRGCEPGRQGDSGPSAPACLEHRPCLSRPRRPSRHPPRQPSGHCPAEPRSRTARNRSRQRRCGPVCAGGASPPAALPEQSHRRHHPVDGATQRRSQWCSPGGASNPSQLSALAEAAQPSASAPTRTVPQTESSPATEQPGPAAQIAPVLISVGNTPGGNARLSLRLEPEELGRVQNPDRAHA